MSESPEKRQRGIENLLAERKKFESWIAQLNARRATTAEHVFTRVHADYTTRLDEVRSRLVDEAEGIRALVGELETRHATEQRLVTEKTDERAEAELRASVGEFSEKEWASAKGKLEASIDDLRAKFDRTERELSDLKGVLGSIAAAPPPRTSGVSTPLPAIEQMDSQSEFEAPAAKHAADLAPTAPELVPPRTPMAPPRPSAPQPRVSASVPRVSASVPRSSGAMSSQPSMPVTSPPAAPAPFDELAFLKSVAGTPSRPASPVDSSPPAAPAAPVEAPFESQAQSDTTADEPGAYQSVPDQPFAPEPEPEEPEAEEPARAPRGRPSSKAALEDDEAGSLGGPTPRTSQAIRSLKCQECGTLNFPTEWYCERCGGELAAF